MMVEVNPVAAMLDSKDVELNLSVVQVDLRKRRSYDKLQVDSEQAEVPPWCPCCILLHRAWGLTD
jgi:hypothetical protein